MTIRIRMWAGTYVAGGTGVVLGLCQGPRLIEYQEIEPGEEFEVRETVNGFYYAALWHEDEGFPRPSFERVEVQA